MPAAKKVTNVKQSATKKKTDNKVSIVRTPRSKMRKMLLTVKAQSSAYLARRPHRSFKRTLRRDYTRTLKLPGYWAFTRHVCRTILQYKRTFLLLLGVYAVLSFFLVGIASQDVYAQLNNALQGSGGDVFQGGFGEIGKAGVLLATGLSSGFNSPDDTDTTAQSVFGVLLVFMMWLTVVWLLRVILADRKPKLRDGLYNSGAPIIPTLLVAFTLVLQLLPVAIAVVGFGALLSSSLLDGGVEAMVFWILALLLLCLSLYWITSTLIALVIVTLPGVYPLNAIRAAGDLVVGRRIRILMRLLWMMLLATISWAIVMIPIIMLDTWLKKVWAAADWVPIVPIGFLIMSSLTVLWIASYIFLFYRRIVDDDAAPA